MLKRVYYVTIYAGSWLVFAVMAMAFNVAALALLLLRGRQACAPVVRAALRTFLALWIGWLRWTGLVRLSWEGIDENELSAGPRVWVANHPGLLDAVFLLSRVPNLVCVFKRTMVRNPFFAPAAILGGHPRCGTGPDFVREAVRKIAAGQSMLIFPEGTRTSEDAILNPLLPGFALIAARAGVPVQVVVIEASRDLLPRGRPWWRLPRFPASVRIRADVCFPAPPGQARETAEFVADRLKAGLV
jgi:1-acyl-sn-glycerol-3-phosphate acyltransferase